MLPSLVGYIFCSDSSNVNVGAGRELDVTDNVDVVLYNVSG